MNRRTFLSTSASAVAATVIAPLAAVTTSQAGALKGKIRKCLKWGMVQDKKASVVEAFRKLKACGYEGVEPNLAQVKDADAWIAASKETGLVIDCVVSSGVVNPEPAIDLVKKLGGDSILVTAPVDVKKTYDACWKENLARIKGAAAHAEKQGIKILIENVWASFLISPLDMQKFVDEIGHPFVGVHYDVGNVMRWGVAEHWVQVLGKRIQKLDIKEYHLPTAMEKGMGAGFRVPIGEGSINWPAVHDELAKMEFSGWAAAEVAGGDWEYLADVARRMDKVLGQG